MSSTTNTASSISPLLKKVYPDEKPLDKKSLFRKIKKKLKKQQ